jgi:hypothetical protein
MDDPMQQLVYALDKYREQVEVATIQSRLIDSARQSPKRPAYVKLAVPDEMVKSLRGSRQPDDLVLLVRIPKNVQERAGSRIVLPGEV